MALKFLQVLLVVLPLSFAVGANLSTVFATTGEECDEDDECAVECRMYRIRCP